MIEIPITKGHQALIDDEDFEAISPFQWSYHGDGYAARGYHEDGKLIIVKMHQAVLGKPPKGFEIDHINGNKLDNRKCNLRVVTHQQNTFNTKKRIAPVKGENPSRFKGVVWRNERNGAVALLSMESVIISVYMIPNRRRHLPIMRQQSYILENMQN